MPNYTHMNRRQIIRAAALTAGTASLGAFLSSCGNGSTASTTGTVTLNYWDYYVSQAPWVDNEIKLFQQAHPNIKIKKSTQGVSNYANLYELSVRSKKAPDVAMVPLTPDFNAQIKKQWWLPLDKYATTQWRSKFPEGSLHEGSNIFDGKFYSAPLTQIAVPFQLYVNHSVFRQAELVDKDGKVMVPRTWDQVTKAAEQITKKSNGQVYGFGFGNGSYDVLSWWQFVFLIGSDCPGGGSWVDLRTGKYTYASNRNYADWIKLLKSWKDRNYFYPNSISISDEVARAYFERGKFGMTVGGVWNQAEWTQHQFTDYSLIPLVGPKEQLDSLFAYTPGGATFAVSASTKHPDEAWAWFDWLYSVEAGKRWVQMGEELSIFPQNNDPKNNSFGPFSQYVGTSKYAVPGPDVNVRNPNAGSVVFNNVKPAMGDVLTGYYTGQINNLEDSLKSLAQRSQDMFDKAITAANQQGHKISTDDYVFADWDPKKPYITKPAAK